MISHGDLVLDQARPIGTSEERSKQHGLWQDSDTGMDPYAGDPLADEPLLAECVQASLSGRVLFGGRAGSGVLRLHNPLLQAEPHNQACWAILLKKTFDLDMLTCSRCAGPCRVVAAVTCPAAAHPTTRACLTVIPSHPNSPKDRHSGRTLAWSRMRVRSIRPP